MTPFILRRSLTARQAWVTSVDHESAQVRTKWDSLETWSAALMRRGEKDDEDDEQFYCEVFIFGGFWVWVFSFGENGKL